MAGDRRHLIQLYIRLSSCALTYYVWHTIGKLFLAGIILLVDIIFIVGMRRDGIDACLCLLMVPFNIVGWCMVFLDNLFHQQPERSVYKKFYNLAKCVLSVLKADTPFTEVQYYISVSQCTKWERRLDVLERIFFPVFESYVMRRYLDISPTDLKTYRNRMEKSITLDVLKRPINIF